jgi:hypothetical protein
MDETRARSKAHKIEHTPQGTMIVLKTHTTEANGKNKVKTFMIKVLNIKMPYSKQYVYSMRFIRKISGRIQALRIFVVTPMSS